MGGVVLAARCACTCIRILPNHDHNRIFVCDRYSNATATTATTTSAPACALALAWPL